MSTKKTTTDDQAPKAPAIETVLDLATTGAKDAMGLSPTNKTVSTTATLTTAVTENGKVTTDGVNAGVTLGVTHTVEDAAATGTAKS